jgi:ABC-type branched-subunit amino acid transport system substrate-binding protein
MRHRRILIVLGALLAALVLAAAGCGGDDEEEAAPEEQPAEEVSFDLTIGHVAPFTGDLSDFGPPGDKAAKVAAELIDEAVQELGLDISVEYLAEDSQTDATAGVEAATKLVQTDGAQVIIGAWASAVTIPVAESVMVPNGIVQISPASTSPAIEFIEDDDWLWRTAPSDTIQAELLVRELSAEFGADATLNTGTRNDAYGTALIAKFEEFWEEAGGSVGNSVRWNPDAPTFDSEAQQLASANPDGWVIVDFPETWAKFGPALVRAGGWDPTRTFTTDGLASDALPEDAGGQATEGMRGTRPAPGGAAPAGDAFGRVFEERGDPDIARQTFDAQTFDAVMVAFLAAVKAGSSDPEGIRDNLQDVSGPPGDAYTFEELGDAITALLNGDDIDYEGASGVVNFGDNGDPSPEGAIYETWEFSDGTLASLETFTFPFE